MEETQSDKIVHYVIQNIKDGVWNPGDRIYTEKEFCEKLSVSRVVVREALEQCSVLGLLERKKGAGTFVRPIELTDVMKRIVPLLALKATDVREVLVFRKYFEPGNVEEFIRRCTEEDVEFLAATYERMKRSVPGDPEEFYLADYEFHHAIARGTGNPIIIVISEMLQEVLKESQGLINNTVGPSTGLHDHREILAAIRRRDTQVAKLLMERHIEETIRLMRREIA